MLPGSDIRARVRDYLLDEVLSEDDHSRLDDTTALVTSGVLDSIATLELVSFLEETFGISLAPHEVDAEHLDTLAAITDLVRTKLEP